MFALVGACGSVERAPAAPEPVAKAAVTVTANNEGHVVMLVRGQNLIVRLAGNATTGFRWTLAGVMTDVLEQQGQPEYVLDAAPDGRVGVGGTEIWRFKAARSGRHTLQFEYRRPWEKGIAPARSVTYSVVVR